MDRRCAVACENHAPVSMLKESQPRRGIRRQAQSNEQEQCLCLINPVHPANPVEIRFWPLA